MNSSFLTDFQENSIPLLQNNNESDDLLNLQLKEENLILKEENESLKSQISRFETEIFPELQASHMKIRDLTTQLQESNKNSENAQNRLKLSQMKFQEIENKHQSNKSLCEQLQNDKDTALLRIQELEKKQKSLSSEVERLKQDNSKLTSSTQTFYSQIFHITGSRASSLTDVISIISSMKENQNDLKKQEDNPNKNLVTHAIVEKIQSRQKNYKALVHELKQANQELTTNNNLKDRQIAQLQNEIRILKENESKRSDRVQIQLQDTLDQLQNEKSCQLNQENKISKLLQENEKLATENDKKEIQIQNLEEQNKMLNNKINQTNKNNQQNESKLNEQINQNKALINQLQDNCKQNIDQLNSTIKAKRRLKKQLEELENEYKGKMMENSKKLTSLELSNRSLEDEKKTLLSHLQAAQASHIEANSAFDSVKQEVKQREQALSLIRQLIEKQKNELETMSKEKQRLLVLIRKQSEISTKFEHLLLSETEKTKLLDSQVKKFEMEKLKLNDNSNTVSQKFLTELTNKFINHSNNPTTKSQLRSIITAAKPTEEILFSLFEVLFKNNESLSNQIEQLNENQANIEKESNYFKNNSERIQSIIKSTISSFKKILSNQTIKNNDIVDFLTNETSKLESVMKDREFIDSQFISLDFLFNGSYDERKKAIMQISENGWNSNETFSLFCVLSLINIAQEREIKQLRALSAEFEQIQETLNCSNANEVIDVVNRLSKKLKKSQRNNQSLIEEIQSASIILPQNEELQQEIQLKQNEINNLKDEIEFITKENLQMKNEVSEIRKNETDTQFELLQKEEDLRRQNEEYMWTIDSKTKEIKKLENDLVEANSMITSIQQELKDNEQNYVNQIQSLEQQLNSITRQFKLKEKQYKAKIKQVGNKYQGEIDHLEEAQNEIEEKMNQSINAARKQNEEKEQLIRKISESLKASEGRNQLMMNDLSKLKVMKKSLEMKIESLTEQIKRDEQILKSKFEFQLMSEETKHQEELANTKARFLTERDHLIIHVLSCFNELDQFDDKDINVSDFETAITHIGEQYVNLKRQ